MLFYKSSDAHRPKKERGATVSVGKLSPLEKVFYARG
jgi:hypothetical protein